ncbi:hypothetical protein M0812_20074 [Anaeramoeba flamelloides]|uniref:Uncharacterized protein n=1 Tax=Anaeramoeba flamelloides TaxID=1746091 RepID=A0AAV7YYW5_9EUKA|nr:hypothetical protein M0812_20074 [Anaeramoeba flamelloides]
MNKTGQILITRILPIAALERIMIDQEKVPFPINKNPLKYNTGTFRYCPEKVPKHSRGFGSSRASTCTLNEKKKIATFYCSKK